MNAEQVTSIGRNVLSMEDYLLSIQYFNLAIKAKPYLAEPYYLRGIAKLSLEDYEGAVEDCSKALKRNKFKTEAYKARGFAYQQLGRDSLAVEDYQRGLEYNPTDKYFLYYKGVALTSLRAFDEADSTFSELLRIFPKFDDGFCARARMNMLRGDTISSIKDINNALEISKSSLPAYLLRAEIEAKRGEWEAALGDMDESIRLRPDEVDFYINRAYLRYNAEDFFGAMSDYNYALQLDPENISATFNRALLRFEVRELEGASQDFSSVLRLDPGNFHALYNRGLVYLQNGDYKKAEEDFQSVARRFPRFHPVYYALAQTARERGDMRKAVAYIKEADKLVGDYVKDPVKNPLDRPTIAMGSTNSGGHDPIDSQASEEEVMERFNQLVTSSNVTQTELSFNDRIKGRVQDRNLNIQPEMPFALGFIAPPKNLGNIATQFRDLDILNTSLGNVNRIYMTSEWKLPEDEHQMRRIFGIEEEATRMIENKTSDSDPRPLDYLIRGIARTMLRNYDSAIADLSEAISRTPDFRVALYARAIAYFAKAKYAVISENGNQVSEMKRRQAYQLALVDFDDLLRRSPGMAQAWLGKGVVYYEAADMTSAIQSFTKAIESDPNLGQAYFNRGLAFMRQGNRQKAFSDLSKAGELGILPSYNILKRMKS